ncbi:putative reverse transcriptase domain-containing protein [Tanacetum coccineum]
MLFGLTNAPAESTSKSKEDHEKNQKYEWDMGQQEALQTLKDKLCNALILSLPDIAEHFVVYCASKQGLGCVLMQRGKVTAYASQQLKIQEKNYTTLDLELGTSSIKEKLLDAQNEVTNEENALAEMLRGLDQQMERKGNGGLHFMDKMYYHLRDMYWWPGMKKDLATNVSKCLTCSKVSTKHQRPSGLLQQPEIYKWKWDKIMMDFITKFPRTNSGHYMIWVVVDRLTKSAHFLEIREDYSMKKLSRLYINEIVARHGVPVSIISDQDG